MQDWDVDKQRRGLLLTAAAAGATWVMPRMLLAAAGKSNKTTYGGDLNSVRAAIEKQRPEAIKRLQNWIALPSIAAENRNMQEGVRMMIDLLKDAGFQSAKVMPTDGQPGVFATLDAGAARTIGMYFRARCHQPKGTRGDFSCRAACAEGGGPQAAGEYCAGGRG